MAGKRLQKPTRRRKKRGRALIISYLVRAGMLAALLACVWLAVLGVRACADWIGSMGADRTVLAAQEEPEAEATRLPEEPALLTGPSVQGTVTIDPGHGGIDPGCGEEGALEKDIVLPISMALKELLEQAGVTVVMTRQTDETLSLDKRAEIANAAGSDLFVSVHCNAFEGAARGMDCYYHKSEQAKALAQLILDKAAELGIKARSVQKNNYQVLWDTDMTAVLVETGFLTDPEECALLSSPDYRRQIAKAIAAAVLETLGTGPA